MTTPLSDAPARLNRLPAKLGITAEEVSASPHVALGAMAVSPVSLEEAAARLEAALRSFHEAHHLERGMPRPDAIRILSLPAAALDTLIASGRFSAEGPLVSLPGHSVRLGPEEQAEADRVLSLLRDCGLAPPEATTLGAPRKLLETLLREGTVERVGAFLYDTRVFQDAARKVWQAAAAPGGITVSQMRELLGITRKHAVPLAEAFDHRNITVGRGDARHPGPVAP